MDGHSPWRKEVRVFAGMSLFEETAIMETRVVGCLKL